MQEVVAMADAPDEDRERTKSDGDGETTSLLEEAIDILAELPEDQLVFITGPHTRWLFELQAEFEESGLVGVRFVHLDAVLQGKLRGRRGVLLVDDMIDLPAKAVDQLFIEAAVLEHGGPRRLRDRIIRW